MINKQKMPGAGSGATKRPKDVSQKGNEVRKGDGIEPLSYDPVKRRPYWDDPEKLLKE